MCHGLCRSHDLRELPAVIENFHDAQMQNPLPEKNPKKKGRPKRGKVEALIDHLILRKDQWLFFSWILACRLPTIKQNRIT